MAINKVTEFTVERSKWLRGKGSNNSYLVVSSGENAGKMCCMGFYGLACGVEREQLEGHPAFFNCHFVESIMLDNIGKLVYETNDDVRLSGEDRESFITKKLNAVGITVTFVD